MFQIFISIVLVVALLYGYTKEEEVIAWEQAHLFKKKNDDPKAVAQRKKERH